MHKCNACGATDSIRTNGDCGGCQECGSIEDYEYIEDEPKSQDNE